MKQSTVEFIKKTATSRKFWAAVTASVPFALAHDWEHFAMVWMGYAGIQGTVDAASEYKKWGGAEPMLELPESEFDPDTGLPRGVSGGE